MLGEQLEQQLKQNGIDYDLATALNTGLQPIEKFEGMFQWVEESGIPSKHLIKVPEDFQWALGIGLVRRDMAKRLGSGGVYKSHNFVTIDDKWYFEKKVGNETQLMIIRDQIRNFSTEANRSFDEPNSIDQQETGAKERVSNSSKLQERIKLDDSWPKKI